MALPSITGYTIIERLGTGGFASVYLATRDPDADAADGDDGGQVAIKILHAHSSNEGDLRRFERERVTMRAFTTHPNIVSVYDSGETEDGSHYTVLEFVEGGSVRDTLKDQGAIHWSDATRIAVQVCSALDAAHRSGVLHRDVKPANILLSNDDVKLSDFGIARLIGQSQVTAAQSIIGTLAYTPPEMFHDASFDGRGDIYQLGITMYEMLLGRAPFTSAAAENKAAIIRRIIEKPAPPLAPFDIPQQLSDLLDEVLSKDPADRPQTARRLGERLNEIERDLGRTPTPFYDESDMARDGSGDPAGTETIHAPTMPIDIGADPTVAASEMAGDSVWPAAAAETQQSTPTPPVVVPPADVDMTVAGPNFEPATSVMAGAESSTAPLGVEQQASVAPEQSTPTDTTPPGPPAKKRRGGLLLALLLLVAAAGAGIFFALDRIDDDSVDTAEDVEGDDSPEDDIVDDPEDDTSPEDSRALEFAPLDDPAFSAASGASGIIFNSVANSQGLTMVGGVGDGERVGDQRSVVWTLGDSGFAMQRDFEDSGPHRMWSIGVIDGETFLAVGDTPGVDGIAWTGSEAESFTEVSSDDFTGAARDQLRASVEDTSQELTFLVGGSRSVGASAITALWEVSGIPSWSNPTWTQVDLGSETPGVINDIAVTDDLAVAVGQETNDGINSGIMLIRRGDEWSNLIPPQPNVQFWGVVIDGEQIIAVGEQNTNTSSRNPVAVISDSEGVAAIHTLPIRDGDGGVETGIARALAVLSDGSVVAVGDVGRRVDPGDSASALDRDGAIWQYLPDQDVWTTRASPDLLIEGFTELWTIDEWDDTVYIFGRTETDDDRRPAGAWTLTLN